MIEGPRNLDRRGYPRWGEREIKQGKWCRTRKPYEEYEVTYMSYP